MSFGKRVLLSILDVYKAVRKEIICLMIPNIPLYIPILWGLTVLLSLIWFYYATQKSNLFLIVALIWIGVQALLGLSGVYLAKEAMPPRILLFGLLPSLILIVLLFSTKKGKEIINRVDLKTLTWFHSIRIPVEIVIYMLFSERLLSQYMTVEGTNFDLLSGISAPIVTYLVFRSSPIKKKLLFVWNILALGLLANVVISAILAFPSPFQILSLQQPNVAVMYFPFNLLPTFVVPLVLLAHLIAIKRLRKL